MRLTTLVAGVVAGVAGLAGGVAGYQQLTASPRQSETVQVADAQPTPAASSSPSARVRLRDCPRGFLLKARACVREVERTVVIDVTPPASAARAAGPAGQGLRVPGPGARAATDDATDGQGSHGGRGAEVGDDRDESDDRDDDGREDDGDRDDHADEDDPADEDDHADEDEDDPADEDESDD